MPPYLPSTTSSTTEAPDRTTDRGQTDERKKQTNRRLRTIFSDTFAFVRSMEINQGLSAVTLEDLIAEQIARNGETEQSNKKMWKPYEVEASSEPAPESENIPEIGNYVSGSSVENPTKMDRLLALRDVVANAVADAKLLPPDNDVYTAAERESNSGE